MKETLSVNRLAWKLLNELIENAELYGVKIEKTDSGTTIIDAGANARGGFEAGKIITEICMGGCAKAAITHQKYGDLDLPSIQVYSDHPVIATLGSQYAGWQINKEGYFAIGSGPARALAQKPKDIYGEIGYKDNFNKGIIVLEADKSPPANIVEGFASDCKIAPQDLAIVLTPTASLAGATQVSGRIVETGIHKLRRLGLDANVIIYASGYAPISPVHPKFVRAMARTNDAILYGGTAYYVVEYDDEERLKEIANKAPSMASEAYGRPFIEIFKEAKYDFYKIDPNLFAPAVLMIDNVKTGNTFQSGKISAEALSKSFDLKKK
ncbi:MAG TPA: methenyltetrahydromethanopterin cyclohydrolase [candidate division Zixibacteria bacterium]|nr:methenyltetrahydromethanopterin cyclohydrolase [candidate division Zixibacteria bacterium]